MKWILVYSFLLFLILRLRLQRPYDKFYPEDGLVTAVFDPSFFSYLQNIEKEIKIRFNPSLMSWREPGACFSYPDEPASWQDVLRTRKDRYLRTLAFYSFIGYGMVLIDAVRDSYVQTSFEALYAAGAVLAPLFWLKGQANADGLMQGYLNGYTDGYHKAYSDAQIEGGKIEVSPEET